MSSLLNEFVALGRRDDRSSASSELARRLGGSGLVVFVRDHEVGVLLPAPGFPQTLPGAREWRRLVDDCAASGESSSPALLPPEGGVAVVAYAFSSGRDVVAVVTGARSPPPDVSEARLFLPLVENVFQCERAADYASAREQLAKQAAAHAEALAAAFNQSRIELRRALSEAQESRRELAGVNERLGDQAMELEAQAEELSAQAEQLHLTNSDLEMARQVAEAANLAKSQFLTTMSHELRTPLNAIAGHVQLIELGIHGPVTPAQAEALERIDRSQRHLLSLINDVLNLARIEAGRVEYKLTDLLITDLLADLAAMVEPQILAKQLRYNVTINDLNLAVRADEEKIRQVLLNVLSNAIKFTPAEGWVELTCGTSADSPDTVCFYVSDSGIGIPEDKLASIFEPFVQVNSTHSRPNEGTGLGLAISRDLARGMGGDLRARSSYGEGSTFTLILPRAA